MRHVIFLLSLVNLNVIAMELLPKRSDIGVTNIDVQGWLPHGTKIGCLCIFPSQEVQEGTGQNYLLGEKQVREVARRLSGLFKIEFLRMLNFDQALALHHDLNFLIEKKDEFSPKVIEYSIKLRQMLNMPSSTLAKRLDNKKVQTWFNNEPLLFENLVKMLDETRFNDQELGDKLCACLKEIRTWNSELLFNNFAMDDEANYYLDELKSLRKNEGKVLPPAHKKKTEEERNKIIELKFDDKSIFISQHRLVSISEYFSEQLSLLSMSFFDLTNHEEAGLWGNIANGELPAINVENLCTILSFNLRFKIDSVKHACDDFLAKKKSIFNTVDILKKIGLKSCSDYWQFCCSHHLDRTKKKLCAYFGHLLNYIEKNDDNILDAIMLLDRFHHYETCLYFKGTTFRDKLTNAAFLHWIYSKVSQDRCFYFLYEIIKHFCSDPDQWFVICQVW